MNVNMKERKAKANITEHLVLIKENVENTNKVHIVL